MRDWELIKAEYISSGATLEELSAKYSVSFSTIQKKSAKEKWQKLKQKIGRKTEEKTIEKISSNAAKKAISIISAADTVLDKTMGLINSLEVTDIDTLKSAATILKILKEVKDVKSEADAREQEARINKLRKEAEDDTPEDRKVNVTFIGDVEEYSK